MNKIVAQNKYPKSFSEKNRADLVLVEKFKLSRNQAQKKIKEGKVFVNNKLIDSKSLISLRDKIVIEEKEHTNKNIKIDIVFEDEYLLVINKPTGISSHPAPGEKEITISELFFDKLYIDEKEKWPGVVHRLDKGTSGIMILAKTSEVNKDIKDQFKNRKISKSYLALVEGILKPMDGIIDIPIKREIRNRERFGVNEKGKEAKSKYSVIKYFEEQSLLEIVPETGRTHQLRVHLSAIGYPIVGDARYGKQSLIINRIFLHATKISFIHPIIKEPLTLEAPLPKELIALLEKLKSVEKTAKN